MTTTDFDASKLEPGTPELEHGSSSEPHAVMAYSQAVSLKRIADAMTANTEQHDRVAAEKRADAAEQQRGYWFKAWRVIIDGVIGPRPMCRDCADEAGACPTRDGLPCDPSEEVVERFRRLTARAEAAEKRLAEVEAREQELAEALEELIDTLTPAEQVPSKDPAYGDEVRALGARIGFGALMSSASREWRDWLAENGYPLGSEFVSGPCRAVLESDLRSARRLTHQEKNNG